MVGIKGACGEVNFGKESCYLFMGEKEKGMDKNREVLRHGERS